MADTEVITRATLGRSVQVGQLYDVRNDQVLVSLQTFNSHSKTNFSFTVG